MISISADIAAAERMLSDIARTQLPFATALALNDTAADVKAREERSLGEDLDGPTPFTKRGLFVRRASKRTLTASVGVKDLQAGYLKYQVKGGTRTPKGRAIPVPVSLRLNKYGNMPRGALGRLGAKKGTFATSPGKLATRHLAPGIYQRGRKGAVKMLVAFEPRAQYKPKWSFVSHAERTARAGFQGHFITRLRQALATLR